jgi:integrase
MAKASKQRNCIREIHNADGSTAYKVQVVVRGHAPIYKRFTRRTDAKRYVDEMKTEIRRGNIVSTEAERTTLKEGLERLLREVTPKKKGRVRDARRIRAWMKHPLAARFLSQLSNASKEFAKDRDERLAAGNAESTVRSELMVISGLFKIARKEWGMAGLRNPISDIAVPNPGRSNERKRPFVGDEEQRLLAQLKTHGAYYAPLAELAIESAMRQGELLSLTWADVNLDSRVAKLRTTKNSEAREVPLSPRAVAIIRALPRALSEAAPLFPLSADRVMRTFRQACNEAGIENLKFHDLRHVATTRICKLMSMHEAMRVTGHKTPSMLMRYYQPKAEDLARKLA